MLQKLDKHFARIEKMGKVSKRHYEFVIQSDHGQCNGATLKQRNNGKGLDDLVKSLLPDYMRVFGDYDYDDNNMKKVFIPLSKQIDNLKNTYHSNLEYIEKYVP